MCFFVGRCDRGSRPPIDGARVCDIDAAAGDTIHRCVWCLVICTFVPRSMDGTRSADCCVSPGLLCQRHQNQFSGSPRVRVRGEMRDGMHIFQVLFGRVPSEQRRGNVKTPTSVPLRRGRNITWSASNSPFRCCPRCPFRRDNNSSWRRNGHGNVIGIGARRPYSTGGIRRRRRCRRRGRPLDAAARPARGGPGTLRRRGSPRQSGALPGVICCWFRLGFRLYVSRFSDTGYWTERRGCFRSRWRS